MTDDKIREKVLVRTSWVSTIGNTILSVAKIVVGIIFGSLAVLSDGIDSATDVLISIVMLFTAGIINRKPSRQYVYSYQKAEGVATMILSMVIFYAGIQMLFTSASRLFSDEVRDMPGSVVIYVTLFSIFGKLLLALYQFRQGKRINSKMLIANAKNMSNDVVISVSVLIGLVFTFILKMPILDTVTGLVISLFIIRTSVQIFIEANVELMDGVKDTGIYERIFEAVGKVDGASNPHRVRSRQIGNMYMVSLDVEADGNLSLEQAHTIAQQVEDSIKSSIENIYDIVVHVEPKGTKHEKEKFGIDSTLL